MTGCPSPTFPTQAHHLTTQKPGAPASGHASDALSFLRSRRLKNDADVTRINNFFPVAIFSSFDMNTHKFNGSIRLISGKIIFLIRKMIFLIILIRLS
jgi:hypothetical protein